MGIINIIIIAIIIIFTLKQVKKKNKPVTAGPVKDQVIENATKLYNLVP